jgi:hypothetical protein
MIRQLGITCVGVLASVTTVLAYTCSDLVGDPRALALGGAYTATASGALGSWSNPAAVARIMTKEAAVAGTSLSEGRRLLLAALALGGKRDGWFIGVKWAGVGGIKKYSNDGEPAGEFNAGDAVVAGGYARALSPLLFVGGRVRFVTSYLDDEQGWGAGVDAGVLYLPLPPLLKMGGVVENIGAFQRWAGYSGVETRPATIRAGVAIGLFEGKVSLKTEMEQVLDGSSVRSLLGFEFKQGAGLFFRAGSRGKHASFGVGIDAGRMTLDFALVEDALAIRPASCLALSIGL